MNALLVLLSFAVTEVKPPTLYAANEELRLYMIEAGSRSPALQVRHAEWQAALERVPQATSLDDPMFTLGYFLQSEVNNYRVALAQKFPWFGTLRTRGEGAAREADEALQRFYDERNRVFGDVKKAYFEYAFLGESIRVTEDQLDVLGYMKDIVESKYSVGMAREDEVLRIAMEITQVADRRDGFLQFRPALVARLNEAMGAAIDVERPWPQPAGFPPALPSWGVLEGQLLAANPDLKRLDYLLQRREAETELARKKGNPDFTLGLEYVSMGTPDIKRPDRPYPASLSAANRLGKSLAGNVPLTAVNTGLDIYSLATRNEPISYPEDQDDSVMVSLQVNVPIWRKKVKAGIAEARFNEEAAHHDKRRRVLALQQAAKAALFAVEDGARRHALFEESLTPQARQSFDSLQMQYATGSIDSSFLDVLDSIQTLLAFELEQVRALRDWRVGAAELEYLIGGAWAVEAGGDGGSKPLTVEATAAE